MQRVNRLKSCDAEETSSLALSSSKGCEETGTANKKCRENEENIALLKRKRGGPGSRILHLSAWEGMRNSGVN